MSYENPKYIETNPNAFNEAFATSFKEGQARLKEINERAKEREKENIAYNEKVASILNPYSSENETALAGIDKSDEGGRLAIDSAYTEFSTLAERIAKTGGTPEENARAIKLKQGLSNLNTAKSTFESTLKANLDTVKKGNFSNTPENLENRRIAEAYSNGSLHLRFDKNTANYVLMPDDTDQKPISLNNFLVNKDFLKYDEKGSHDKFEKNMTSIIEDSAVQNGLLNTVNSKSINGDMLRFTIIDPTKAVSNMVSNSTFTDYVKANANDIYYNILNGNPQEKLLSSSEKGYEDQQKKIAIEYATKVYSNNMAKPYASNAVTNVTQEAKDTRQKYLDAAKYGKDKEDKVTEAEKNKEIRNIIYNNASALAGKAKVTELLKLKDVLSGWTRVAGKGNETKMQRKTSQGGIEIINTADMDAETLRSTFTTY